MRMFSAIAPFLAALTVGLLAGPAAAQSNEEKEAFSLFKEGRQEMDAGRCEKAIELFQRAYTVFALPQILLREAECQERLGDFDGALDTYLRIRTDDEKVKARAFAAVQDLRTRLGQPIEVSIETNVPDVDVTVDHVEQHRAPVTLRLSRGVHHFEFKKPGHRTIVEDKAFQGANSQKYAVILPPAAGRVVLLTDAGSFSGVLVRIDDHEFAPSDARGTPGRTEPIPVPAGPRNLLCVKEGRPPFMTTFNVPTDGIVEMTCRLGPPSAAVTGRTGRSNPWKWVTFSTGTAVALAGAGLSGWYFGTRASGKVVAGTNYQEGWIGVGMMGVGVAAAVASFFLFPDAPTPTASASVAPHPTVVTAAPLPGGAIASFAVGF